MNTIYSFKLSSQGRIATAISLAIVLPMVSVAALADNIKPVGNTSVSQVGGVDVVNIANPNAKGLSHNQYNDFNVSKSGAVLNNSLQAGKSQLAGQLNANSNLTGTASVILNEVVSKNPSLLLGQQEVFGMAADYILANPNGITGKDIGFINTNRASLVVGTPTIAEQRLSGFSVGDRNSKTLALSGDINGNKRLDLLAPKVDINGNIKSSEAINVISGRNKIDYDTLQVSNHERSQPHVTLDGQILGSMNAGRIRLHNTDTDATQTLQGQFNATQGFDAAADTLNVSDSQISANNVSLAGTKQLSVGGDVKTIRTDAPQTQQKLADNVTLTNSGYQQVESFKGSSITGGDVALSGNSIDVKGSKIDAANIDAKGSNINVSGITTTTTNSATARNTKGLWFNENETLDKSQQYHKSELTATDGVNVNATGDIKLAGASLKGSNVALTSGNNITATNEVTEDSHSAINRYARETASLKTGTHDITQATQKGYQTDISGNSVSLTSGGEQRLEGIQLTADTATLNSAKDLTLAGSNSSNRQTNEEDFKYWGGIGGGETHIDNKGQTALAGSQINAKDAALNAEGNINVTASGIKASDKLQASAVGDVNISNGFATEQDYKEDRHGTAFNITDKKVASDRLAQNTVASGLSAKDVSLTGENITVSGSDIAATDSLSANANKALTTNAANPTDITKTETYDITAKSDSSSNIDFKNGIQGLLDPNLIKDLTFEASGSLKGVKTLTTVGSGSSRNSTLAANNANLKAQDVSINGTQINAANNVAVKGNKVSTGATEALTAVDSKVYKSTGPEAYIKGGATGIEVGVSIGHDQIIGEHNEYQAVNSTVNAGNSASLNAAETLTNKGTQINAAKVDLSGQDIVNDASYGRVVDRKVVAGGNAALNVFAGVNPIIGGGISLSGDGVGETTEVKTAHTTGIVADDAVNIAAVKSAVDAGTQIKAGKINISADDYNGSAAYNSTVTTRHSGHGDVNVNAGTSDLTSVNIKAGANGTYQYLQKGDAKAVKGSLNADTVNINAGTRAVAAQDVTAKQYNVTAGKEARIGQNSDKQWTTAGGAKLGGSVGVTVIPAAVTTGAGVLPSVSALAGFNYLGEEDTQAKAANINVTDLTATAGELAQVDGANINADSVVIKGNRANIAAAQDTHRAVGVAMNGNAAFAPDLSELGFGGNLGVVNETSNKAHGATISTKELNVAANEAGNALSIDGANITANNIGLTNANDKGDVNVIAAESKDYVGNFGIGGTLDGAVKQSTGSQSFESDALGAHLNVKTDNSNYYTLGNVKADNININTGNDIKLQSNVDAGSLTTKSGNGLALSSAQDQIVKVNVDTGLKVDGSPIKFINSVTAGNVIDALKNDFNDGTILGVSVAGNAAFDVDNQKITHQATIKAGSLNTTVGSGNIDVKAAKVSATGSNLNGATVTSTNNDDFVHQVGATVDGKTFSVPKFVGTIPGLIKDAFQGKPLDLGIPVHADVTYKWDDTDGANTKSDVSL
ncbi:hemagglutinin repeat-containing protein [Psychrobacter sp.]|uniref:two-partner secretion domain-containing protein n=1 Tax=Psychrobacter sp. TaxID=56811 RepID=UPI0025EF13A8|nr:hemagglutinin repeat-containing protein [Psychrobacter sp.]